MLTFLELYQTVLGFVFFKLYTDLGLVYPPPLDSAKDEGAAGVRAYSLQETSKVPDRTEPHREVVDLAGKKISGKDVRKTIKLIDAAPVEALDAEAPAPEPASELVAEEEEEFVTHPSTSDPSPSGGLPTLKSLTELPSTVNTSLLKPFTFFLSRETPRSLLEFVILAFGGRVGWTPSQGGGSPILEDDVTITHVIVDRPARAPAPPQEQEQNAIETVQESEVATERRRRRKYVQPQWVIDCVNKGRILLEGPYERGKTLPPHLSPFGEADGAYGPEEAAEDSGDEEIMKNADEVMHEEVHVAIADAEDPSELRAAELEAEAAGVDYGTFAKAAKKRQSIKRTPTEM